MFFEDFEKHLGESVDSIGGKSFRIGEMADSIERAENIGRTVNQKESRSIRHDILPEKKSPHPSPLPMGERDGVRGY